MKTSATMSVLDRLSLAGTPGRPNEDALGFNASSAFVVDGATGLGGNLLVADGDSDAAWLAEFARLHFEQAPRGSEVYSIVADLNAIVGRLVTYAAGGTPVPRWQHPVAGFSMVRCTQEGLAASGLGDCSIIATGAGGAVFRHTPHDDQHGQERAAAAHAIAAAGGLAAHRSLASHEATRAALREARARLNTPGNMWTLGTSPEAGRHVSTVAIPLDPPVTGLIMTDGFAALTDSYGRYRPDALVKEAEESGLEALGAELRRIETADDPDGQLYPRFKVSDDASAILFRFE